MCATKLPCSKHLMCMRIAAPCNAQCDRVCPFTSASYSELYVPFCGVATLEALSGVDSGVVDPFLDDVGTERWTVLQKHQEAAVDAAYERLHPSFKAK